MQSIENKLEDPIIDILEHSMKKILVDLLSTRENNGYHSRNKSKEQTNKQGICIK
jgi:hypothetical protein